jgi:capsular exopolysaccharide synthesis family protein
MPHTGYAVTPIDRRSDAHRRPVAPVNRDSAERYRPSEQLVSLLAPDSFAADQYRTLRHTIECFRKESRVNVIAVTSPGPGDGKTVTTLNLAGALAQSADARVLVMDADLRRPSVAEYLGLTPLRLPGLAEAILDSDYDLARVVRRLEPFNLSVVPAGVPQPAPYELLNSPRLEALLGEVRRQFDYVLIDTPPSVPLPDCRIIERWVDGLLVVVAAHKTSRRLLAETLNVLDPAKVLGIVFNADDRPMSGYYGYYGDYYANSRQNGWWQRLARRVDGRDAR